MLSARCKALVPRAAASARAAVGAAAGWTTGVGNALESTSCAPWQHHRRRGVTDLAVLDDDLHALPAELRSADLRVTLTNNPQPKPRLEDLKFGKYFTDHMMVADWVEGSGWGRPEIHQLKPLELHPACQVLHYGTECFEGMKIYHGVDMRLRLFRPDMNLQRLSTSAARLRLPEFDQAELLECLKQLVRVDASWVPDREGYAVYVRPTLVGTTPCLGVAPPSHAKLFIILSPVGPYFANGGLNPVKLFLDEHNARAWPGGAGYAKIGGNYAPTVQPQVNAAQYGCSQVIYVLQTPKGGFISESGAMNLFFFLKHTDGSRELVTPPLDGTILPGVTRDSVLELARSWGEFNVSERPLSLDELLGAISEDRLLEAFGTGTACVVQPLSGVARLNQSGSVAQMTVPFQAEAAQWWLKQIGRGNDNQTAKHAPGESLSGRLMRALMDIQYGITPHPWSVPL